MVGGAARRAGKPVHRAAAPQQGSLSSMAAAGPDFLCVGMMKTGTGWLFDQLQFHADFWMPPIKELHYLNRDSGRGRNARNALRAMDGKVARPRGITQAARRAWDERDVAFLTEMASHQGEPLDLQRYAALFRFKGALKSGDVTPQYGALEDDLIERIGRELPETRAVLLIRDPVARAWSAISMQNRFDRFDESMLENPSRFRNYVEESKKLRKLSFPTEIVRRWTKFAPNIPIGRFFFDDIVARPDDARREILLFLGADPDKPSGEIDPAHNRKARARKLELTEDIKAVLIEYFRDELIACAEMFGGHALQWKSQYGV
jgi:hypothetical protein